MRIPAWVLLPNLSPWIKGASVRRRSAPLGRFVVTGGPARWGDTCWVEG